LNAIEANVKIYLSVKIQSHCAVSLPVEKIALAEALCENFIKLSKPGYLGAMKYEVVE